MEWQKLPSVRVLAAHLGIATDTVQNALKELRTAGLVVGRQGSGTCIADDPPAAPSTVAPAKPRKHDCKLAGRFPERLVPNVYGYPSDNETRGRTFRGLELSRYSWADLCSRSSRSMKASTMAV